MAQKSGNKLNSKGPGGGRIAALAILALILLASGGYLLFKPSPPGPSRDLRTSGTTTAPQPPPRQPAPATHPYSAARTTPSAHHDYHEAVIIPEETPPGTKPAGRPGRLAIIIDDMGSSMQEARALAGIGVPLTFSVIPGLRNYREVAAFATSNNIETMIHMPMQSQGWPERRLEANGLLVSMSDEAIAERLEEFMSAVPKAVGANNHMGSEFTEHEDKMRAVLTALKGKGLFFVDSVTSPKAVGLRLAKELGMKSGKRSVFLDNEQNPAYIQGQLNQAVRLAKKTDGVIAICHPHPVTIRTLEASLPGLAKQGITLVPASQLVK